MTKTELITTLAKQSEMEKKQTKMFLEALTTLVTREIKKGGEVPLTGLGEFKVQKRKARIGRNPRPAPKSRSPRRRSSSSPWRRR